MAWDRGGGEGRHVKPGGVLGLVERKGEPGRGG